MTEPVVKLARQEAEDAANGSCRREAVTAVSIPRRTSGLPSLSSAHASNATDATSQLTAAASHQRGVDAPALVPGQMLGSYRISRPLGEGAMGMVFLAEDLRLRRNVALKLLLADFVQDPEAIARLRREARSLAQLSHPHVVQVYGVEQDAGLVYLVMEYVEGEDLKSWLAKGARHEQEVLAMFVQAGQGLFAAHSVGLVHRDFKPANVLIGRDGRVRVADFGLARANGELRSLATGRSSGERSEDTRDLSITSGHSIAGTPRYMAPEQHEGGLVDARADQYAFCIALYEALTETRLFEGRGLDAQKRLGPRTEQLRRLPSRLRRTLARGLSPTPADRFPSMEALLARLHERRSRAAWLLPALVSPAAFMAEPDRNCDVGAARIGGAYDDQQRSRIEDQMRSQHGHSAARHFEHLHALLQGYAEQWHEAYVRVCESDRERLAAYDQQMSCLKSARVALEAQVRSFQAEDVPDPRSGIEAVLALPEIELCLDEARLTAHVDAAIEPPDRIRPAVESLQQRLEDLRALARSGQLERVLRDAPALIEAAERLGFSPLTNLVRWELVRAHYHRLDLASATLVAERLYFDAQAVGQSWLAVDAAAELVNLFVTAADFAEAKRWAQHARAQLARRPHDDARWSTLLRAEGRMSLRSGQMDEAVASHEAALQRSANLGADHPETLRNLASFANVWVSVGKHEDAVALHRKLVAAESSRLGPDHPALAPRLSDLGAGHYAAGDYLGAQTAFRKALDLHVRTVGERHWALVQPLLGLAATATQLQNLDQAEALLRRAVTIAPDAYAAGHGDVAVLAQNNLAAFLYELGRLDEAEQVYHAALAAMAGIDLPIVEVALLSGLGDVAIARADRHGAERWLAKAREHAREHGLADSWGGLRARAQYGRVLFELGREDESLAVVEPVILDIERNLGERSVLLIEPLYRRGLLFADQDRTAARRDLERALDIAKTVLPSAQVSVALALAELLEHEDPSGAVALVSEAMVTAKHQPEPVAREQSEVIARWLSDHPHLREHEVEGR